MAYRSGMFNSVGGDRKYQAAHFAEYFATFIGNGVFPNPSNGLQVYAKENMTVTIKPGKAWINGYYFVNDSDCDLKIENADGVLKRKDRIVLRFDTSTRLITPQIRKGVFSASPAVPTIQRDADAYELALATISIDKGTVALTQSAITDERLNTTVCGIVHGVVDQVDTATLFSQYQTWYAEKMEQYNNLMTHAETSFNNQLQAQQTAFDNQSATNQSAFDNQTVINQQTFDEWFITVQNLLSGDVAANIIARLDNHSKDTTAHGIGDKTQLLTTEKTSIVKAMNELFINADDGKTAIANAIVGKGGNATSDNTFAELATAIQKLGKDWASGEASPSSTYLIVSGLKFKPSLILLTRQSPNTAAQNITYIYSDGIIIPSANYRMNNATYSASVFSVIEHGKFQIYDSTSYLWGTLNWFAIG